MASIFAILYIGAIPIPIDIESETYNLDVNLIEDKITKNYSYISSAFVWAPSGYG